MISLHINQIDIARQIFYVISQLALNHYTIDSSDKMPFAIYIKNQNNSLYLSSLNSKEIKIQLPCRADNLVGYLENISKNFYFSVCEMAYYPLDQKLQVPHQSIKLNLIHNLILKYLLLNKNGIAKAKLYKIIWPNDKDYQVNKLDTHITNLKNLILKELEKNIIFESNYGVIKIDNK